MLVTQLTAVLALAASALAAPATITLREDDVLLYGNGRYQLMKRTDFDELEAARKNGTVPPMPGALDPKLITTSGSDATSNTSSPQARSLQGRGDSTIIIPAPDSRFLGWDVQMSQVASGAPTTISVSTGFSIANSISVGVSASLGPIKSFLTASAHIDYSKTWTTTQTQQFTGEVPKGKFGAFVSNPWTNRKSGTIFTGHIGNEGSLSTYQADSFDNKGFDSMQWVDGVISLCLGDALPLKRCLGDGTL